MIDKIIYTFLGWLDSWSEWIDNMFFSKPKRKKKKCKSCHCNCHCKDDLHLHFDKQALCTCDNCEH